MTARGISMDWVEYTVDNPSLKIVKASDELHLYSTINTHGNRCLKVVINPISMVVITVYFDRNMRKRGCK